jgi:hypothetical protein
MSNRIKGGSRSLPEITPPGIESENTDNLPVLTSRRGEASGTDPDAPDYFAQEFLVVIPEEMKKVIKGNDTEERNQSIAFELQKIFLQSPQGAKYSWLPQAVEGFVRSQRSVFTDVFGSIESIAVDPKIGKIVVKIRGEAMGSENDIVLHVDELRKYSLELVLQQMDDGHDLPGVNYSEEMRTAVDELSESAQHRWGMITRAARHVAAGQNQWQGEEMRVAPVTKDRLIGDSEGVGVFMEGGPGGKRWSSVKVVFGDVPMTAYEKHLLELDSLTRNLSRDNPNYRDTLDHICSLAIAITDIYETRKDSDKKWGEKLRSKVRRLGGTYRKLKEFGDLVNEHNDLLVDRVSWSRKLQLELFNAKGRYQEEHPFELTEVSEEVKQDIIEWINEMIRTLQELLQMVKNKRALFAKVLGEKARLRGDDVGEVISHLERLLDTDLNALLGSGGPFGDLKKLSFEDDK